MIHLKKRTKRFISVGLFAVPVFFLATIGNMFLVNILSGRVHMPEDKNGEILNHWNGQNYKLFRRLVVDGGTKDSDEYAVFKVRFKFSGLEPETNKRLSIIPAPFLMGMKGFREKRWMYDEKSGYFQGVYQWASNDDAASYPDSFIFKVMTKRSAPGTLSYEILPHTKLAGLFHNPSENNRNEK